VEWNSLKQLFKELFSNKRKEKDKSEKEKRR
jgi:hypothetical protein